MQKKITRFLSALLVLCLLLTTMSIPTYAANGTATLSSTTMTESGSITVTFSQTATSNAYYKIEIADSSWSTKYVNTSITSGDTYTISGYSAGTYQIYIGYWESGSWVSDALSTITFTVTKDEAASYDLALSVSDSTPALGDSVTVTASFTVNGTGQSIIPDGCYLSLWYQHDSDWVTPVNGSTSTTSATISVSSSYFTEGSSYTVRGGLYDSDWNTLASAIVTFTVSGTSSGDSGSLSDTYAVSIIPSATSCEQNGSITFTATVTCNSEEITLSEQSDVYLWIWTDSSADGHSGGLTDCSISPNTGLANAVTITFSSVGTYYIAYTLQDSSYSDILKSTDVATITVTESSSSPSEEITTGSYSDCSFMRGMDLSTFYVNWTNGAVYYDYDGTRYSQEDNNAVAFFQFLYNDCGVNWVRIRVWNDPSDESGNTYGGGNNDLDTAVIIGKWASDAGMTVLIDFHYSDFWADPDHQLVPKAWSDMTTSDKSTALYNYTYSSLQTLLNAGVNVGMVQVGNETNGKFCGISVTDWSDLSSNTDWQNICILFNSGSSAVRAISEAYGLTIKVALHFTNPNNNVPSYYARYLTSVDYDVMGISYYMYWHGTLSNLTSEISTIKNTYGKEVFIAETAYPYTDENFDDLGNQVTSYDAFDYNSNLYAISEAGQEAALTAILDTAVNTSGCTGMFYWEPAWITTDSDNYRAAGGGWATIEGGAYISYTMTADEGSSFDNQTLFDNNGKPLAALKFFVDYDSNNTLSSSSCLHSWSLNNTISNINTDGDSLLIYTCSNSNCKAVKTELTTTSTTVPRLYTRTITLDGGIGLNYYVYANDLSTTDMANYSVRFTVEDESTTAEFDSNSYRTDFDGNGTVYYRFTGYLTSVQLAESVTVELLYKGTTVIQTDRYSVQTYCQKAVTNSWPEAELCAALLNYGGYAQTYFGDTGTLANSDSSISAKDQVSSWSDENVEDCGATVSLSSVTSIAKTTCVMSLTLESMTVARLYFALEDSADVSTLSFVVSGANLTEEPMTIYTVRSGNSDFSDYDYYVEMNIPASRLSTEYTFTVTDTASSTGTVKCSALSYVYAQVVDSSTKTDDENLLNVCKSIYYYSDAADSYKNWYTGTT